MSLTGGRQQESAVGNSTEEEWWRVLRVSSLPRTYLLTILGEGIMPFTCIECLLSMQNGATSLSQDCIQEDITYRENA